MPAVILFVSANPSDTRSLALDEEYRAIGHERTAARLRDAFDLRAVLAATIGDVRGKLKEIRPAVIHFGGHGVAGADAPECGPEVREVIVKARAVPPARGELALMGPDGRAAPAPLEALAELFRLQGGSVRCVVLNACNSLAQARALAAHVDCAIGTTGPVTDAAAIAFAKGFYGTLCDGETYQQAFDAGRNNVGLERAGESGVFEICMREPGKSEHLRLAELPRAPFKVPFPQDPHFVGREEALERLHAMLQEHSATGVRPVRWTHGAGRSREPARGGWPRRCGRRNGWRRRCQGGA